MAMSSSSVGSSRYVDVSGADGEAHVPVSTTDELDPSLGLSPVDSSVFPGAHNAGIADVLMLQLGASESSTIEKHRSSCEFRYCESYRTSYFK